MKSRSWIKSLAASALLSPKNAFRKADSLRSGTDALPVTSIPLAMLTTLTSVIEFLDENHFDEEGLYSQPGVDVERNDLLHFFREHKLPALTAYNPHSIASVVKEILSEHYTPLIPADICEQLLKAVYGGDINDATEQQITETFKQIRSTTRDFLKVLLGHLHRVSSSGQSRMGVTNLALDIGIALIRPKEDRAILNSKSVMRRRKCVAEYFIRKAASLPYDCATEMNIPAIPELVSIPTIDPIDSSSPVRLSAEQLHFIQVSWDAGESIFTPQQLEEIFGKYGEIENLGINDQGNRAIIAYSTAASAEEAERASIPFVHVRRRKPRQNERRREHSTHSPKTSLVKRNSRLRIDTNAFSGTDSNEPKQNFAVEQKVDPSKLRSTAMQSSINILPALAPRNLAADLAQRTQATPREDSIVVEDIEDDQQQLTDDSSIRIATDLQLEDDAGGSQTNEPDLQTNTDDNDTIQMTENTECSSPKLEDTTETPPQAEKNKPNCTLDDGPFTDAKTEMTMATQVADSAITKTANKVENAVDDPKPSNSALETPKADATEISQQKLIIAEVDPAESIVIATDSSIKVDAHATSHSSPKNVVPLAVEDDFGTHMHSADSDIIVDALQSKLIDMKKILSTSTTALSTTKVSSEFNLAMLQLHNQVLGLVTDCLVLTGIDGDVSDKSRTSTTANIEFLDFLEAQSRTQVKILEVEVRAGQELLRLHKTQYEKERIEMEEELTVLRVGRTESEGLCAELRADLRKCRCELACHVANATYIQRQKSELEEKLVVCENQLHAREKAVTKLQENYDKMHRVAAEAQSRVEKFKMGDYSEENANQSSHSFSFPLAKTEGSYISTSAGSSLPHTVKFLSKHPIHISSAKDTAPFGETATSTPVVLTQSSNVAALKAMQQQMARDIQEQIASTRAALKEMEICSSSGKTLAEEEAELRQLQKQFAARSSEMDAAMNESRAKLRELIAPAALSSRGDKSSNFEEFESNNQEPTIFDSTKFVNELIARAEGDSEKNRQHGNAVADELFLNGDIQNSYSTTGFGNAARNQQPARDAQSNLYKKWTADRRQKNTQLVSYRDQQTVLQAQKSMQTFQQALAKMRGQE